MLWMLQLLAEQQQLGFIEGEEKKFFG